MAVANAAKAGYSKQVLMRPDLHKAVAVAAAKQGCSIQHFIDETLRERLRDELEALAIEPTHRG